MTADEFKQRAAIAALQGAIAYYGLYNTITAEETAIRCEKYARELTSRLYS